MATVHPILLLIVLIYPVFSVDTGLCVINIDDKVFSLNFISSY